MKKHYHGISVVVAIMAMCISFEMHCFGKRTIFGIRSQGLNAVRELAGWQKCMFKYDQNRNFGALAATVEYDHSFRPQNIADFLFGTQRMNFSGSANPNRMPGDVLADYFGLPTDFSSTVCVNPIISSFIVDFNYFQAFDAKIPGLFFMLHAPIIHTKWNLNFKENSIHSGTNSYPAGYMSATAISAQDLPQSVTQALLGTTRFGDMQDPLRYGKVMGRQERTRVSELQATVGWNYNALWYHAGISFRVGAPTGNSTDAEFLFEDIVGNRHHWDVGLGLSGHVNMWENKEAGHCVALYADARVSHLCMTKQKRSYDLTSNGTGSRYMLLEDVDGPSQNLRINGNIPENQYTRMLSPVINKTTFDSKISIGVQADIVVKLAYQKDGFEFDIGYNFWTNSKEKLHCRDALPANRYALKGDGQLYGFLSTNDTVVIPLNATQHDATIFAGQGSGNSNFQNLNADNQPALAANGAGVNLFQLNSADALALKINQVQVRGSNSAILLHDADINNESGLLPRALSNKFFVYANYMWDNRDDFDPYAGFGVSAEVANTNACNNGACSQWALWFKTGFAY